MARAAFHEKEDDAFSFGREMRWLLDPWMGDFLPFVTVYGAVAFAVWYGGYVPALVAVAVSVLVGMISARFRDVPPIVANIVTVVFFIPPIFWPAEALGENSWWAELNPMYAAIDVMRAPLLGQATAPHSWAILMSVTAFTGGVAFAFFARFRSRIAFWV